MSRRGYEAPMDFSYDNGTGPVDAASPFASLARNTNLRPTPQHSFTWGPSASSNVMKPLPREPPSSSQPSQRIDFTTPRKPRPEVDFDSSAGETPGSPDKTVDSVDATPEQSMGLKSALFGSPSKQLQQEQSAAVARKRGKAKRESFFSRMGLWSSPAQGEVPRTAAHPQLHQPGEKVRRKRSQKALVRRRNKDDDPEWEDDEPTDGSPITAKKSRSPLKRKLLQRKASGSQQQQQVSGQPPPDRPANTWASFFTYLEAHPHLPSVLSYYAQFAFNLFLLSCLGFIMWGFWAAVRADVDEAAAHAEAEALTEIALCAKNYKENGCDMATRVPALQAVCANWERCLERDPKKVGRARVSAHTFARIFNSFIEPISYKAMIFTLLIIFGTFFFSNLAFGFFRSRAAGAASVNYPPPQMWYPPPTPRHPSNGMLEGPPGYYTPHHTRYGQEQWALEPAPSQSLRSPSGGSPIKKLDFA